MTYFFVQIQEFCYDNQNFLKCFNKIILLFYKTEVLSEEVILKWYKDGHAPKGWTVFMDQMKKFVEWLEQAESGNTCEKFACCCDLTQRLYHNTFCGNGMVNVCRGAGSEGRIKFELSVHLGRTSRSSSVASGSTTPWKPWTSYNLQVAGLRSKAAETS